MEQAISFTRNTRRSPHSLSRWFKRNPILTRILITFTQFLLMGIGLLIGHNLFKLDIILPSIFYWTFATLMIVGFTLVPFFKKKREIVLPSQLRKNRWVYALVGACLVGIMTYSGNVLEKDYPNFFLTKAVQTVDREMFPQMEVDMPITNQEASEKSWSVTKTSYGGDVPQLSKKELRKAKRLQRRQNRSTARKALIIALLAAGGALMVLLTIATCLGVCLVGGGVALFFTADILGILGGLAAIALGIVVSRASVRAIRRQGPPPPGKKG